MNNIYKNLSSSSKILVIIAIIMAVFSGWNIYSTNKNAGNFCEKRTYVEWTKDVAIPVSEEQKADATRRITECNEILGKINDPSRDEPFWYLSECSKKYESELCRKAGECELRSYTDKYKEIAEKGYETNNVPDEDSRTKSREEVKNYENCIITKETAIKNKSEGIGYLIPGNAIILVVGLLMFFALKNSKKD